MRQGGLQLELSVTDVRERGVRPRAVRRWTALAALLIAPALPPAVASTFETEPVLDAATLVAPALLSGPGWSVAPKARVVGYQARFLLRTDHGEIEVGGVEMLAVRVSEIPALDAVHGAGLSDVFLDSAGASARERVDALDQVGRNPLRTLVGIPGGVARYFGKRLARLGERASRLSDRAGRGLSEDGNPYDDVDGPMAAARSARQASSWHEKPRREVARLARNELDHSRARRQWAQRLGVDPQTSNPLLRPRLDALAWAAVGGDRSTALALAAIGGGAAQAVDGGRRLHEVVWQLDPADLRARNRARISPWCKDETLLRRFLWHRAFNSLLQTALVESVRRLDPARGCEALLETALMAASEQEARFVVNALRLLRHQLGERAVGGELRPLGATLAYVTADGELLLPLAVDYLSWTAQMQEFFDGSHVAVIPRTLLVSGAISLRAQRELTERGWSLVPHLPYPGAPPYAPSPARP